MFLNEEYFRRHSVDAPLVKASERSNLIFRTTSKKKWKTNWVLFEINKIQEVVYRPPYFLFKFLEPIHDGCEQPCFTNRISEKKVYFDEYELEVVDHVSLFNGLDPIVDLSEAKIASWEIFLFCNDYRIGQIPLRLRDDIWGSIDKDSSIENRMQSQENVLKKLPRGSSLSQRWDDVSKYCNPLWYADWFAKIIYDVRNKNDYQSHFSDIRNIA